MSMIRLVGILLIPGLLAGCVDLDQMGIHPELRTTWIDRPRPDVEQCLINAAKAQQLNLTPGGTLPGNTDRYLLQGIQHKNIAEVDIRAGDNNVTGIDFYYFPDTENRCEDIESMLAACKT
ncbi:hypothetical protein [Yokenella regensburgei]|uniref:hypothetical protein n=1 Tax=Yokenella regensburgei TaxID=158877 RepID=UPI001432D8CF|nr:hypothetical protein [Yokenella regensburgei]QIU88956.1 hypothetical protein HEC60_06110 [Yokenella regensburgei]